MAPLATASTSQLISCLRIAFLKRWIGTLRTELAKTCITFKKSICEKVRGLYVIPGINIKAAIFIFKTISRKQAFFSYSLNYTRWNFKRSEFALEEILRLIIINSREKDNVFPRKVCQCLHWCKYTRRGGIYYWIYRFM